MNNGPLTVWNVLKHRYAGKAVRIERGMIDSSDVLIVNDEKAVILTDKGFVSMGDEGRPMYQTVLVYDLIKKKYIHKIQV